jgi:probable phosphoglycerate mutase
MSETRIFLARHGETAWTRDDRFCGSSDIALSPTGMEQAERLARALRDAPISAVYASPLGRTIATAIPAAAARGLSPQLVPDLRELDFGAWEGRARAEVERDDAARWQSWIDDPATVAPEGGETGETVARRATPALLRLAADHPGETLLVLAHKTVNRLIICHLLGLPIRSYRQAVAQDVCALNQIVIGPAGAARVVRANATAHLREDVDYSWDG